MSFPGEAQLEGKRILVVRPHYQSDPFVTLLEQSGADINRIPVIEIEPVSESQAIKNLVLDFDNTDIAIFVSGNAARLGMQWLDQYWPMLPVGVEYFAVGSKTAEVLREYLSTEQVAFPSLQQNSEGLLAMPQLQSVSDKRVVIFSGCGGRKLLSETLAERGARVDHCELYERKVNLGNVQKAQQQLLQTDILVAHSGDLLNPLGQAPTHMAAIVKVVVPSERVADIARKLGYIYIKVADSALPEAMYEAVVNK